MEKNSFNLPKQTGDLLEKSEKDHRAIVSVEYAINDLMKTVKPGTSMSSFADSVVKLAGVNRVTVMAVLLYTPTPGIVR